MTEVRHKETLKTGIAELPDEIGDPLFLATPIGTQVGRLITHGDHLLTLPPVGSRLAPNVQKRRGCGYSCSSFFIKK
jgi:hypothetical protein